MERVIYLLRLVMVNRLIMVNINYVLLQPKELKEMKWNFSKFNLSTKITFKL